MSRTKSKNTIHIFNRGDSQYWWMWVWAAPDDKHPKPWQYREITNYKKKDYTREQAGKLINRDVDPDGKQDPDSQTVRWLREHILERLKLENRPPSTIKQYRNSFDYLIDILGPDYDIRAIERSVVWRIKEHGLNKAVTPETVNTRLSYLHAAFNILMKEDLLETNPFRNFTRLQEKHAERKHLTLPELKRFLVMVDAWDHEVGRRLVRIVIYTGLRRQEILLLERVDVNLDKNIYRVINIKSRDKHKRWLPIPDKVLDDVAWFLTSSDSPKPFKRCHPDTLGDWTKQLLRKAGFPDLSTKSLRHTFATLSLEAGISIRELQLYLDHSDVRVTELYAHDLPNKKHAPEIGI